MTKTYRVLMERFNWTTNEIDKMDFNQMTQILFDDHKQKEEPLQFIDQVFGT